MNSEKVKKVKEYKIHFGFEKIMRSLGVACSLYTIFTFSLFTAAQAAEVVQRNTVAPVAAVGRARPVAGARVAAVPVAPVVEEIVMEERPTIDELTPPEETKAAQFREVLQGAGGAAALDDSDLRKLIAAQRAAEANTAAVTVAGVAPPSGGANVCNDGLRACMSEKCPGKRADGTPTFSGCAGDGDTIWNDKMDSCRRTTKCTGREYDLIAPQIKADRDIELNIGLFDEVITCGGRYNECIIGQCGPLFDGCLGKAAGDRAISNCKKIADECRIADSGLPGRAMEVFGMQREAADIRVRADYARLLEMREQMEKECLKQGGTFDARSFECVFSVCIFNNKLAPSDWDGGNYSLACQKLHPGSKYTCYPEWFGIDVTTFMEEAQRMTRAQMGSSGAFMGGMLGAGAGTAVNAAMTGAMFNDGKTKTQEKKETAQDALEKECEAQGGVRKGNKCSFDEKDIAAAKNTTSREESVPKPGAPCECTAKRVKYKCAYDKDLNCINADNVRLTNDGGGAVNGDKNQKDPWDGDKRPPMRDVKLKEEPNAYEYMPSLPGAIYDPIKGYTSNGPTYEQGKGLMLP